MPRRTSRPRCRRRYGDDRSQSTDASVSRRIAHQRRLRKPCLLPAKVAQAKNSSRVACMPPACVMRRPAGQFELPGARASCSKANCSVTSEARSPGPTRPALILNWPMAERFCWTKSLKSIRRCRRSCCVCCKKNRSSGWLQAVRSRRCSRAGHNQPRLTSRSARRPVSPGLVFS